MTKTSIIKISIELSFHIAILPSEYFRKIVIFDCSFVAIFEDKGVEANVAECTKVCLFVPRGGDKFYTILFFERILNI